MAVSSHKEGCEGDTQCKKPRISKQTVLGFSEEDKEGTIQLHDDALVVTLRIVVFDVQKVMIDQGSRAKIMRTNLFNGLGLELEDLSKYDVPLIGFDGNTII